MTTYVNVYGIKNRLATPARPDDIFNVPLTNINISDPRVISWTTTDGMSLSYANPYYDRTVERDYYIYFTSPNDGITHHYDLGGYFNIPTGYLNKTILSFLGGLFSLYKEPYDNADFVGFTLYTDPPYWVNTDLPVALTTWWSGYNIPLLPNVNYRIQAHLIYSWTTAEWNSIYEGDYDSVPLDAGITVTCNDFGGGGAVPTQTNLVRMIIEQN